MKKRRAEREMGLKKKKVVITRLARSSIHEIYEFVKQKEKSVEIAHYVRKGILDKCFELEDFSGYSNEPCLEDYSVDYRSVSKWSYIIIYSTKDEVVRVLNVLHGKEKPESRKKLN